MTFHDTIFGKVSNKNLLLRNRKNKNSEEIH